jgi:hypothetical protein
MRPEPEPLEGRPVHLARKPNGIWRCAMERAGKRPRWVSLHTTDENIARQRFAELKAGFNESERLARLTAKSGQAMRTEPGESSC